MFSFVLSYILYKLYLYIYRLFTKVLEEKLCHTEKYRRYTRSPMAIKRLLAAWARGALDIVT